MLPAARFHGRGRDVDLLDLGHVLAHVRNERALFIEEDCKSVLNHPFRGDEPADAEPRLYVSVELVDGCVRANGQYVVNDLGNVELEFVVADLFEELRHSWDLVHVIFLQPSVDCAFPDAA